MKRIILAASVAAILTAGQGFFAPVIAADSWVGQYTGHSGSYHWEATITNQGAGIYDLHISVGSRMPACSGDVSAPAKLVGGKLLIDSDDCTLTISRRGAKGIRIEEKECSWHGVACGFDSALTRTSANPDSGKQRLRP